MRLFSENNCTEYQNTFYVPFMRKCGNLPWSGACYRLQYGACALHAGYLRLQALAHRLCNTHCFPTTTMVPRTGLNFMLYVHCLSYLTELPSAPVSAVWALPSRFPDRTVYIQSPKYAFITLLKVRHKSKFAQVVFQYTYVCLCMYILVLGSPFKSSSKTPEPDWSLNDRSI